MMSAAVRVLILSNDEQFSAAVGGALRRCGFEVVPCSGRTSVLPHPDLIVIDLDASLPRLWRSILALRRRDKRLPLVAVSSAVPSSARLGAWRPRGYLRKPFDMDDLLRVTHEVLREVHALDHQREDLAADLAA